ncbi:polysaccharide export protein [Terriglobus saanensis SP1PR4]|uniref:Polysaccharide export protein n=1 Tax=Terriglobus saanensis (strain ATCC BAA-1853 / DSM 23119 / SP1PR4) TaxID=401053 RepID=E8V141_TERSS|nr:polysaccharide export protein [Terriglobus saanensis SP1PR4]
MTPRMCLLSRVNKEELTAKAERPTFWCDHMTLKRHKHLNSFLARKNRIVLLPKIFVGCLLLFFAVSERAQGLLGQDPAQNASQSSSSTDEDTSASAMAFGGSSTSSSSSDSVDDRTSSTTPGNTTSSNLDAPVAPLPADQIIQILQQNPDLTMEVKSQVADRMQQQGMQVEASNITDEMLYNQISTNASVRANITTYLRARGYVSQNGLQGTGAGSTQPGDMSIGDGQSTGTSNLDQSDAPPSPTANSGTNRSNNATKRERQDTNASTDAPKVVHRTTPYNLRSMRDLYTQIPEQSRPLKRFGSEVFTNRDLSSSMGQGVSSGDTPLDVSLGPDYVVGPGDTLKINMWGGVTQSTTRVVDREGQVLLPEAGSLQVAGLPLQRAEGLIEGALKRQYRNVQVSVTISRLRSVRVYVVGDVQRPGGYDISSLATPLSALYAAGGPTSVGSLRIVRHSRGQQKIEDIDLYDFLLHGVQKNSAHFESGDTLQVPPAGPQVAVSGAVKRPAIYELKPGESTLTSVIEDAGGVTAAASLSHITIERIDANRQRETVTLNGPSGQDLQANRAAIDQFAVKDGDRVYIAPILPYSERAIYLQGHVVRPGRLPFADGMRLSDVLRSYQDMLPEPAAHGEIIRLVPPDLHAETIAFDVPEVLIGNANVPLQPFDTVRVFGRYEIDVPKVTIHGEVLRPGTYPLSKGMTTAQLVRMAGGFKRDALLDSADLTSYGVEGGNRVAGQLATIRIGAAVAGTETNVDVPLKPGDILTIHQITGWNDIGQAVTIEGQIKFPGSYGFQEGEHLSSVLRRAGGLRDTAYAEGAVMIREQVRQLQEKSRQELIQQIQTNSAAARLGPALGSGDTGGTLQLIKAQQEQSLAQLKSHPSTGRMVIHISADIDSWANTPADIELRRGDVLTIPKRPGFVLVSGQVYNATALTYAPGKTAAWYLSHAGGTNGTANHKEIFIIRANGSVVGRHSSSGWFDAKVLSTKLNPGDVVVVPQKIIGSSLLWRNILTTAQIASSIAITGGIAAATL